MQNRRRRKTRRDKSIRTKPRNKVSRVYAVAGCTCGHTSRWDTRISLCWRCLIAGLPGAQETIKNRREDRKERRKLIARHGKKSPIVRETMKEINIRQIRDSLKKRMPA